MKQPDGDPRKLQNPAQSAKGEEKGDRERNPWLGKMSRPLWVQICPHELKSPETKNQYRKKKTFCDKPSRFCLDRGNCNPSVDTAVLLTLIKMIDKLLRALQGDHISSISAI